MAKPERKPDGYWSRERVLASSLAFSTPTEWRRTEGGARAAAVANGWYADATAHMSRTIGSKPHKWTKEKVLADAKLYTSRAEWRKSSRAYPMAHRQGWLDEACAHMKALWNDKWGKEAVLVDALKYPSRSKWESASGGAYSSAVRNGWYEAATAHMPMLIKSWTKESVLADARRFQTRGEWFKGSSSYSIADINGWRDEASAHMLTTFSLGELVIHTYLTEREVAFVHQKTFDNLRSINKLPFDFYLPAFNLLIEYHGIQHVRGWQGNQNDALAIQTRDEIKYQYAIANGFRFIAINALDRDQTVAALERELISIAKCSGIAFDPEQKRILSSEERSKIATLGQWTKEEVLASATQFNSITEWKKYAGVAYNKSIKMGWKDEAIAHMVRRIKPHNYWTNERVIASARPFKSQIAWKNSESGAWGKAVKMGWIPEATSHMATGRPANYWTKERVLSSASEFISISDWQAAEPSAPVIARRKGWMDEARELIKETRHKKIDEV